MQRLLLRPSAMGPSASALALASSSATSAVMRLKSSRVTTFTKMEPRSAEKTALAKLKASLLPPGVDRVADLTHTQRQEYERALRHGTSMLQKDMERQRAERDLQDLERSKERRARREAQKQRSQEQREKRRQGNKRAADSRMMVDDSEEGVEEPRSSPPAENSSVAADTPGTGSPHKDSEEDFIGILRNDVEDEEVPSTDTARADHSRFT